MAKIKVVVKQSAKKKLMPTILMTNVPKQVVTGNDTWLVNRNMWFSRCKTLSSEKKCLECKIADLETKLAQMETKVEDWHILCNQLAFRNKALSEALLQQKSWTFPGLDNRVGDDGSHENFPNIQLRPSMKYKIDPMEDQLEHWKVALME